MAGENGKLTSEKHKELVEAYLRERPHYAVYAESLRRVLENACRYSFPEALVQSRAKTVSSFAEKAARKWFKYKDPVHQMTDLCGARVIVQTLEQVHAVCRFIEANFVIQEKDDKETLLGKDRFGYRDMHYIVQVRGDRGEALGIEGADLEAIGDRRAEIQVRTWVQHAWADTLHDRLYKIKLSLSPAVSRRGNLLAALMEEGDRNFDRLADELDGLIANYTAHATQEEVEQEIAVQQLILDNEPDGRKKPQLALTLSRLAAACGDYGLAAKLLEPYSGVEDAGRGERLGELGYALCRVHRKSADSEAYRQGLDYLEASRCFCERCAADYVEYPRKKESQYARVLVRLGWAWEAMAGQEHKAREFYRQAHEHEPLNPYYLAEMLGYELYCGRSGDLPNAMRTTIRRAVGVCREHAAAGIELPYAYLAAGRLNLLLRQPYEALYDYARGIAYVLAGRHCIPRNLFEEEVHWIRRLHFGREVAAEHQYAIDLFGLGACVKGRVQAKRPDVSFSRPILIVAGGAASMAPEKLERVQTFLTASLKDFVGTVISGGTQSGVPGCVGQTAEALKAEGRKGFELVAYIPHYLPSDAPKDERYDRHEKVGEASFSPEQVFRNWEDLLAAGISPKDVILLGFGGGPISGAEYRTALALGATVGIVSGLGGAGDDLLDDPLWRGMGNLFPLPPDVMPIRALVIGGGRDFEAPILEAMAQAFHRRYRDRNTKKLPENLKPWELLNDSYKKANREQAAYAVRILEAAGFGVEETKSPAIFDAFEKAEVEFMAQLEHGRWMIERLRDGWRYGPRDDEKKLHDNLLPWEELSEEIRQFDRDSVLAFPEILATAGLEVYRISPGGRGRPKV